MSHEIPGMGGAPEDFYPVRRIEVTYKEGEPRRPGYPDGDEEFSEFAMCPVCPSGHEHSVSYTPFNRRVNNGKGPYLAFVVEVVSRPGKKTTARHAVLLCSECGYMYDVNLDREIEEVETVSVD